MRGRALLAAGILLVSCHRGAERITASSTGLGRPAREVGTGLFVCPGDGGWYGYGRTVYAPNDSSRPSASVRPDRCFASLDEAIRAGFSLPPPSSGGFLIDGIYLIPPTASLMTICQDGARRLGLTVLCPGIVPGSSESIVPCDRRDCVFLRALVLTFTFSGPPGYVGIPWEPGANHLFVLEARAGRERAALFLGCEGPQSTEPVSVRGRPGEWIRCEDGETMNAGHIMLVWSDRGVRYVVSLHSDTFTNRVIAAAVADRLAVTPAGG